MSKIGLSLTKSAVVLSFAPDSHQSLTTKLPTMDWAQKDHSGGIISYAWFKLPSEILSFANISSVKVIGEIELPAQMWDDIDGYGYNSYWGHFALKIAGVSSDDASNTITWNNKDTIQSAIEILATTNISNKEEKNPQFELDISPIISQINQHNYLRLEFEQNRSRSDYVGGASIVADKLRLVIDYESVTPIITPTFPVNVNVKEDVLPIFTWNFECTRADGTKIPHEQVDIKIEMPGGIISKTLYTSDTFWDISNDFYANIYKTYARSGGKVTWSIRGYTRRYDMASASNWPVVEYTIIGKSEAPVITDATMEARPTITWTSNDQAGYEIKIKNTLNEKVVYETGLVQSTEKTHKVNKMLTEGDYTIEIRILNNYGMYSDWNSYHWVLVFQNTPSIPDAPIVTVISGYFVDITTYDALTTDEDQYWVVRTDDDGNEKIISRHINNHSIDTMCSLNKPYYYKLRHQNIESSGYADSDAVLTYVKCNGIVINTIDNEIKSLHLWKNVDNKPFEVQKSNNAEKTFHWAIGRKYPIIEIAEWATVIRSFKAYVTEKEFETLLDITENGKLLYYRADNEAFLVDAEINYESKYLDGGYIIAFKLTRIDEDEINLEE